jgi:DNA-binding CsgD family transcriptional regulator
MKILERDSYLATLHDYARQAANGQGRLVFLGGESGVGKTTLVEHLANQVQAEVPVSIIPCDGLKMPGPYTPLFDIAEALGPEVEAVLNDQAPRDRIFRAVLSALRDAPGPHILVGEDAHWTDEATLELVRFLGRRIGATRTLFIVTYRDDILDPWHPLRRVLGDLVNEASVTRIWLPPLSLDAIRTLAEGSQVEPVSLHERTGGNPFYATEILASGDAAIPTSIRDAVLARASRVSPESRAVLDAAAVIGVLVDPDLLEATIGAPTADAVDEALAAGLFRPFGDRLEFRHGLAREVLFQAMSLPRRRGLHRRLLGILESDPAFATDSAHLAHHAEEANDAQAVLRHAPVAARDAQAYGAHRQAAFQFARALRFAYSLPEPELAALLEARAYECYLTGQLDEAIADQARAVAMRESATDPLKVGVDRCWLSRFCWFAGRNADAEHHAQAALDLLAGQPPGPEYAMACSNLSQLRMLAYNLPDAIHWGNQAIALATALDNQPILAHALVNVGTAKMMSGDPEGSRLLDDGIRIGLAHGLDDDVVRAWTNRAWTSLDRFGLDVAERTIDTALAFTAERDLIAMELYLKAARSRAWLARGEWEQATRQAASVAAMPSATTLTRIAALTVMGRVAVRQGTDPGTYLDDALALAEPTGQLMRLGPLRIARAEAAWLAGDPGLAVLEAEAVYAHAVQAGEPWLAGELALWLHRCGHTIDDTTPLAEPFALEILGQGEAAATFWRERGCPLEEARALASTGEESSLLAALAIAERLGARPDAMRITQALRQAGATRIPRGPRPQTRANAANLTAREVEVIELLVQGRSNREIADALYLSPRTVGHHVSAILGKLQVGSRTEVHARVTALDLLRDRPSPPPI